MKFGAQPVWYVTDPSNEMNALHNACNVAMDSDASIRQVMDFVEPVRSMQSQRPNDWRWEREWRVLGDLHFCMTDVAAVITDNEGVHGFLQDVSIGVPCYLPGEFAPTWVGGISDNWASVMEAMLERFYGMFISPLDANLPFDDEEERYIPFVEVLEVSTAMDEAFGELNPDLYAEIESHLSAKSPDWCRVYDLDQVYE